MATVSETVLSALAARLTFVPGATVARNSVVPETIPAGGLIILRDGEPGEPEITMSPLAYEYWHTAEIEIFSRGGAMRDANFDALKRLVGEAIAEDRTLGGLCLHMEAMAPSATDLGESGAAQVKAASIPVTIVYLTTDPLA